MLRNTLALLVACTAAASMPSQLAHADDTMVFRFRAGHEHETWTDKVDYKGNAHVVARSTPLSDIYGLNPLNEDFKAADFDGSGDFVAARAAIKVRQSGSRQGLTVQVWFKADRVTGKQVLLSNRNKRWLCREPRG